MDQHLQAPASVNWMGEQLEKESCCWIVYTDRGKQLPLCGEEYGMVVVFPAETKISTILQGTK